MALILPELVIVFLSPWDKMPAAPPLSIAVALIVPVLNIVLPLPWDKMPAAIAELPVVA